MLHYPWEKWWFRLVGKCNFFSLFFLLPVFSFAQIQLSIEDLKKMSLDDLMGIKVTSVSKRPEKLSETASAIQVVTGEDISKFGASNIPEALYLAGNLQTAQKGAHSWGISSRGFNTDLSNKLLVLFDGRTLYTPLFSGVFWERQDYLLEDIKQIEVISGPGGTLWGANAVNGVINITSKKANETQGVYAKAMGGDELKAGAAFRYGGKAAKGVFYRVYGQYGIRDGSIYKNNGPAEDGWQMVQGGFRMDAQRKNHSLFTLQGDVYRNDANLTTGGTAETIGGNVLGRWVRYFSDSTFIQLQAYYDGTNLSMPTAKFIVNDILLAPEGVFKDHLNTLDMEFFHYVKINKNNLFVWGMGYQNIYNKVSNSPALGFLPEKLHQNYYNVFAQEELNLLKNLFLTFGTKLEHNPYVGYLLEPNFRARYNFRENQIVWLALSRAVRTPSRVDRHISQASPPYFVLLSGNENFKSETLIAMETGFKTSLGARATAAISLFYNIYDNIRSTELHPVNIFPLMFHNGLEAETYGTELNFTYQPANWWKLTGSLNLLKEDVRIKKDKTDFNNAYNETADPEWQALFRSSFVLPYHISIHPAFRWVDALPINNAGVLEKVPAYAELDGQITWQIKDNVVLSVCGRNLLHQYHVEYGVPNAQLTAIQRSIYGKVEFRL